MTRPNTIGMTAEQAEWCEKAWKILSATNEFQQVISETVAVINEDLKLINKGTKTGIRIINGEEKVFDRVVVLIKLQNDMKSLSLLPKEADKSTRNPFEEVSKKVKNGVHPGDILEIPVQGEIYKTPPIPELSTIRRTSNDHWEQVWARHTEYEDYDWNIDPEQGDLWYDVASQDQWNYYYSEVYRIHYGEWIMICGVPTYLNPDAYFFSPMVFLIDRGNLPDF